MGLAKAPSVLTANLGDSWGKIGRTVLSFLSRRAVQRHADVSYALAQVLANSGQFVALNRKTTLRFTPAEVSEDGVGRRSFFFPFAFQG